CRVRRVVLTDRERGRPRGDVPAEHTERLEHRRRRRIQEGRRPLVVDQVLVQFEEARLVGRAGLRAEDHEQRREYGEEQRHEQEALPALASCRPEDTCCHYKVLLRSLLWPDAKLSAGRDPPSRRPRSSIRSPPW